MRATYGRSTNLYGPMKNFYGGGFGRKNMGPRRCYVCGLTSHIARECPVNKTAEAANIGEDSSDELAFVCREEVIIEGTSKSEDVSDCTYESTNNNMDFKLKNNWFESEDNGFGDSENGNLENPEKFKGVSIAEKNRR